MADKTNAGMTVFIADITYMSGFGSDGAAVLLSACSRVRCCSQQFLFPSCGVILGHSTLCDQLQAFSGHSVDSDGLHIPYADIFISRVRAAGGSPPQCQLTVKYVFWNATILHTVDMAQ